MNETCSRRYEELDAEEMSQGTRLEVDSAEHLQRLIGGEQTYGSEKGKGSTPGTSWEDTVSQKKYCSKDKNLKIGDMKNRLDEFVMHWRGVPVERGGKIG